MEIRIRECSLGQIIAEKREKDTCEVVGRISYLISNDYMDIQYFHVKPMYRKRKIGRGLINQLTEIAKENGIAEVVVRPKPYRVDAEPLLEIPTLYRIYERLGFHFQAEDVNKNECNHVMILETNRKNVSQNIEG